MPQENGAHAGGRCEGGEVHAESGGGRAPFDGQTQGGERDMFAELGFVKEERDLVMKERISLKRSSPAGERELFIDNLLVRIHFIIVMKERISLQRCFFFLFITLEPRVE